MLFRLPLKTETEVFFLEKPKNLYRGLDIINGFGLSVYKCVFTYFQHAVIMIFDFVCFKFRHFQHAVIIVIWRFLVL